MIEEIRSPLNRDELDKVNKNFKNLGKLDYKIMQDLLSSDPTKIDLKNNGVKKPTGDYDLRRLNDFGVNFRSGVNGIIHRVSIYASSAGTLGVGIAEQIPGDIAGPLLHFKNIKLNRGWNDVVLNFAIEQNKAYTLFRREVENNLSTAGVFIFPWNEYPFMTDGIDHFYGGMTLDLTTTARHYTTFFEIKVITNIAQVYKIMNDSVIPPQQFYVGDNPPSDSQFWFKPVGEE